jgi:hypothetical protein
MYFYNKNEATMSARLPIPILGLILAAASLIVMILTLSVSLYLAHYGLNVDSAKAAEFTYSKSTSQIGYFDMAPAKGYLTFGWIQKKGTSKMKYSICYKKNTATKYKYLKEKYSFKKNKKPYGAWYITEVNGRDAYNFAVLKHNKKKTKSKVKVELGLEIC